MECRRQENNAIFASAGAIVDENDLWMLTNNTDVLLHFDITGRQLLDYYILPGKKLTCYAHMGLAKRENRIFIVPFQDQKLISFDCISGKMEEIDIPYAAGEIQENGKFVIGLVWKTQLILIGHALKGIFYYDCITNKLIRDIGYLEELKRTGENETVLLFGTYYCQRDDKLYLPILHKDKILEIDLGKRTSKIYQLNCEKKLELCTIDGYDEVGNEKFLLTTADDEKIIWSPTNGVEKIKKLGLLHGKTNEYARAFHVGKKNYYIAACERQVFVETDDKIRTMEFEYESKGGFPEREGWTQFEAIFKNGTDIYFQARSNGQMFKIDTVADLIHRVDFNVALEKKNEILRQVCCQRKISDPLTENAAFGLESFLKLYVCRKEG